MNDQAMSDSNCDDSIHIWGVDLQKKWLSHFELDYLQNLPKERPNVEWIWKEMDRVWDGLKLNNELPLQQQNIGEFYSHPIWTVNGIFTKTDTLSIDHRKAICCEIERLNAKQFVDYGGGWGGLATVVARDRKDITVTIVEPYQSLIAKELLNNEKLSIEWKTSLDAKDCELIVAQDVLEHVEDPVFLACKLVAATKPGGAIIFANSFYPVIKCHLPKTFYLRHTFPMVMRVLGMKYVGSLKDARHIQLFLKKDDMQPKLLLGMVFFAKKIGPLLNWAVPIYILVRNGLGNAKSIFG
jgi:2-polyprenyl-3-methyl-5-hydroxy-6-metoxy-1,4-benzoquinol methylase